MTQDIVILDGARTAIGTSGRSRALITMCISGGRGIALAIERMG